MKRIIACCDGTWNRPGRKDRGNIVRSNVELMFSCVIDGTVEDGIQLKAYDEGVGSSTFSVRDNLLGGATGLGIDKNIKDMYLFVMLNYDPGDEIFLFGFSRGAYTARSLAGFIRNCGLLKQENIHLIDHAYELYRDRNSFTHPESDLMMAFKKVYCCEKSTPIKFLGVWDTVGSLGIPLPFYRMKNKNRYQFHDVKLSSTIEYAYHALAVDEKRKLFIPTLWQQSETVTNDKTHKQVMEQRWFSGVHCNVGGGYADHGLSDLALKWLIEKAVAAGLKINEELLQKLKPEYALKADHLGEERNSYTALYWFWWPTRRKIKSSEFITNEEIDPSVMQRHKEDHSYRPLNLRQFIK